MYSVSISDTCAGWIYFTAKTFPTVLAEMVLIETEEETIGIPIRVIYRMKVTPIKES